jgi:hypothetical protein
MNGYDKAAWVFPVPQETVTAFFTVHNKSHAL